VLLPLAELEVKAGARRIGSKFLKPEAHLVTQTGWASRAAVADYLGADLVPLRGAALPQKPKFDRGNTAGQAPPMQNRPRSADVEQSFA
jgi:hypothetical protein